MPSFSLCLTHSPNHTTIIPSRHKTKTRRAREEAAAAGPRSSSSSLFAATAYAWLSHLGTWTLVGVLTVFALRLLGPPVLYACALVVVVLLFLGYKGYLNLNWRRVARLGVLSLDADGDGRLSVQDARVWGRRAWDMGVSFGGTALAGYTLGLWMGVRMF